MNFQPTELEFFGNSVNVLCILAKSHSVDKISILLVGCNTIATLTYNGIKGLYSSKKEISYENEELDVCFFYDITNTLSPGIFKIEVYAEDYDLGVAELDLK